MITDIYLIKTMNSVYEVQVNDQGGARCRKADFRDTEPWRNVRPVKGEDWLDKLVIGASFDVPGVVLTSVVKDYQHFVPTPEPKRHLEQQTTIQWFFRGLAEHVKEQVNPQAVMVEEKTCGIDGCTVTRVPGLPSHEGSRGCKSGSIASGGTRAHCACDYCY